jgi:PhnB protein
MAVKPIPDEYQAALPYLIVQQAADAIAFYQQAFDATELTRLADPTGKIAHAEIKIGHAIVMLADEFPEMGSRSPQSIGGTPVTIMLYVEDVDHQFEQAIAAGAKILRPVEDQFYGDRSGMLADPFGHVWTLATHIEDVSEEEVTKRFLTYMHSHGDGEP